MNQTLTVPLRPSRALALALTAIAGVGLVCVWISLPVPAFVPFAAGILLAWAWHSARALQWSSSALRTLELNTEGGARCEDRSGNWLDAEVLPGSYVSRWLVVLNLGLSGGRRRSLVLLADAAAAGDLRQLRVWLRWRLARS